MNFLLLRLQYDDHDSLHRTSNNNSNYHNNNSGSRRRRYKWVARSLTCRYVRVIRSIGVNLGGWGSWSLQILGWRVWGLHEILLYPIMYRNNNMRTLSVTFQNRKTCVAYIKKKYPGVIPYRPTVLRSSVGLYWTFRTRDPLTANPDQRPPDFRADWRRWFGQWGLPRSLGQRVTFRSFGHFVVCPGRLVS